ncbi:MAG: Hpt domain-containing protein, partial [Methanosarcinaceae archaeon]|nr:Hpt domain-containing protein [Methanosarcinaceae archaeon]
MDIDISEYLDMFVEETRDHLQKFSQDLIELENIKGENSKSDRAELLDSLFRVAHTIKGMSGSMDFKNMEKLCHIMENLLDELKNNIRQVTPDIIDILLNCFTKLEELTDCIENQKSDDIDISEILGILNNLKYNEKQNVSKIENLVQPITNTPEFNNEKNYSLKITIDKACNLKGVRGYLIIEEISKISEIIDTIPSRVDIEEGKFEHSFIVIIPQNPEKRETLIKSISSLVEVHAVENQ